MSVRIRLAAVVAVAAAVVPATAAQARAGVVDCHTWASYPNVLVSSARNMTCSAARKDMRRYRGSISRRFKTPGGFRCAQVSGVPEGGQWRCVKGTRAYRIEFGD
jgi:hypothetical protein